MKLYNVDGTKWAAIWASMNAAGNGYKINDEYKVMRSGDQYNLVKIGTNNSQNNTVARICAQHTSWCCGVMQLGNFWERTDAQNIPDDVADEFLRVIYSANRNMFRKSVMQAWFYKEPNHDDYQHPFIRQMMIRSGMRQIGRGTYNPNSGNKIKGFQLSLRKGT